jgi:pyridoxamine 5'-phosphate oxidase
MSLKSSIKTVLTLGQGLAGGLPDAAEEADPIELFEAWFAAAQESGILLPESVALATSTSDGVPSVRMVLLKGVDARGFVFFTNYGSQKARELDANPRGALCFHWAVLQRQVRVAGRVARVSEEESGAYFATRGRGSQIGAWASPQSEPLESRAHLERRAREAAERFAGGDVPLPPFWGGYRLDPVRIEFWQGRADRLHDRLVFRREGDGWATQRLAP